MRENRTYGSEGGEASAFPTLSGLRRARFAADNRQPTTDNQEPGTSSSQMPQSGDGIARCASRRALDQRSRIIWK